MHRSRQNQIFLTYLRLRELKETYKIKSNFDNCKEEKSDGESYLTKYQDIF